MNEALQVLLTDGVIDEVVGRLKLGFSDFWKFERSTQVSPGPAAVDDGFHAQARIDVLPGIFTDRRSRLRVKVLSSNPGKQRRGR